MSSQNEIRESVTKQIVEAMEKGVTPWKKPWVPAGNTGFPANVVSKRRYTGVNPLLLELSAMEKGLISKWWGTYRQWQALGCQVKRRPDQVPAGQWGTKIIFFKPVTRITKDDNGEEKEESFSLLREYTVFNADQVEGAEAFQLQQAGPATSINFEPAEKVISATGADIRHEAGDQAYYAPPPRDFIVLPLKVQFEQDGLAGYYDTAFHELCHWSESRLGFNADDALNPLSRYALKELRAELGAAFISAEVGIPTGSKVRENHASYLAHWIAAMKEDSRIIFKVASAANAAANFILSFSKPQDNQEEPEPEAALSA